MSVLKRVTRKELSKHYSKVTANSVGYFQGDLMDMSSYGRYNSGFKYGFVVIDVYSRYGWCYPIKAKSDSYEGAMAWLRSVEMQYHNEDWKKFSLYVDDGSEFYAQFAEIIEDNDLKLKHINSNITHQVVAERFIRTIKERIREVFYEEDTFNWVDYIESIIENYNDTVHRILKNKPLDVFSGDIKPAVNEEKEKDPDLQVGDKVRTIIIKNKITDKPSLTNNWSERIFTVVSFEGKNYTLNDGKTYQRWKLLKVDERENKEKRYQKTVREKQIQHRKVVSHERMMQREIGLPFEAVNRMIEEQPDPVKHVAKKKKKRSH